MDGPFATKKPRAQPCHDRLRSECVRMQSLFGCPIGALPVVSSTTTTATMLDMPTVQPTTIIVVMTAYGLPFTVCRHPANADGQLMSAWENFGYTRISLLWRHPVQNLCFKPRPGGNTVQLVRHAYNPASRRSQTVTVGTLDLRADPALFPLGLTLRPGVSLNNDEQQKVADYLHAHADPASIQQRQALAARIRQELQSATDVEANPFVLCARAITVLTEAIPQLANEAREAGSDPWLTLRPSYLALSEDWKALVGAAQSAGIAKQYRRGGPSAADDI